MSTFIFQLKSTCENSIFVLAFPSELIFYSNTQQRQEEDNTATIKGETHTKVNLKVRNHFILFFSSALISVNTYFHFDSPCLSNAHYIFDISIIFQNPRKDITELRLS